MAMTSTALMDRVDERAVLLELTGPEARDRLLSRIGKTPTPSAREGLAIMEIMDSVCREAAFVDAPVPVVVDGRNPAVVAIASDDWASTAALRPTLVPTSVPHNLPDQPTRLLGRGREAETVRALLLDESVRLLTLAGTGGVGKTRLAVAVAEAVLPAFPDGVRFVDLAPITSPALVLPTVARTLGLRELVGQSLHDVLVAWLRDRTILLVLDNFEHILPAAGEVEALVAACPRLKVLVTSREPLHLRREHVVEVDPLPVPTDPPLTAVNGDLADAPCVALFLERAHAADASFSLTDRNVAAVVELCRRLDGVPLAIELAAARVRYFDPAALLARLDHRLSLLRWEARDLPARQRSLQAALDWSHDGLAPEERAVFRRLGVFAGGFTIEAAAEVVGTTEPGAELFDVLASLVEKHLLRVSRDGGEPRFGMLETIRAYALAQLAAAGETDAIRDRHLAYYLRLAEEAKPELQRSAQAEWFDRLQAEHDNLRAALARAATEQSSDAEARLVVALWRFWVSRGHFREGFDRLEAALARGHWADPLTEFQAIDGAGTLALWLGDLPRATTYFERALALARVKGMEGHASRQHANLGMVRFAAGDLEQARRLTDKALAIARQANADGEIAYSLRNTLLLASGASTSSREWQRLRPEVEEAVAILRRLGDLRNLAVVQAGLGRILAVSDPRAALAALRESLDLARRLDDGLVTFYLCWTVMLLLLEHRPPFLLARLVGIVEGLGARANAAGNLNFGSAYSTPQSREALRWAVEAAKRELGETGYVAAVAVGRTGTDHALREVAAALEEGDAEPAVFATETRTVAGDGLVSVREAEVLDLVAQGLSNKVIADRLFIAPTTAKFHVTSLLNKLGADTRAQLVAVAAQRGLLA